LSTHLRLCLPSSLFPSGFPTNIYMHSSSPHSCYMPSTSHPPWLGNSNYTWRRVQVMKLLIMQFSPTSWNEPLLLTIQWRVTWREWQSE
jgi:hypothetical protein